MKLYDQNNPHSYEHKLIQDYHKIQPVSLCYTVVVQVAFYIIKLSLLFLTLPRSQARQMIIMNNISTDSLIAQVNHGHWEIISVLKLLGILQENSWPDEGIPR